MLLPGVVHNQSLTEVEGDGMWCSFCQPKEEPLSSCHLDKESIWKLGLPLQQLLQEAGLSQSCTHFIVSLDAAPKACIGCLLSTTTQSANHKVAAQQFWPQSCSMLDD